MITRDSNEGRCISFVRVISMLMIFFCHVFRVIDNMIILNQLLGCATFTFLFISGYLYGNKENQKFDFKWMCKQIRKILIPVSIWTIFLAFIEVMDGIEVTIPQIICNCLGLTLFGHEMIGGGHLYYVTIILICYLLTPLLDKMHPSKKKIIVFLIIMAVMQIVVVNYLSFGRCFVYISVYVIGFFYSRMKKEVGGLLLDKARYAVLTVATFLFCCVRGGVQILGYDNTLFYAALLSYYSIALLGVWCFFTLSFVYLKLLDKYMPTLLIMDKYSYEVYIVHFAFTVLPFSMIHLTSTIPVNIIVCLLFVCVMAFLLNVVSNNVNKSITFFTNRFKGYYDI